MSRELIWQDEVWNRHITLFEKDAPFTTGLASLPAGWRELIDKLLASVAAAVAMNGGGDLTFTRLRHRHGVLSIEWSAVDLRAEAVVNDLIERATARASCTCGVCGEPGRRYMIFDHVEVGCNTHHLPSAVEIRPNWPLIRIDREIREGRSRIVRCRLYDRQSDAFLDANPAALGIPEAP